ncbi:hypothetical protein CR513_35255, partial [Mucuna pruriens]
MVRWCFSRSRKCRSETGKLKFARRADWDSQHTLVNLILSAQAIEGEPPPSTTTIVVEDGDSPSLYTQPKPSQIDLYRDHLGLVSAKSDSTIAEASQYSTSQILRHFSSHRITFEHNYCLKSNFSAWFVQCMTRSSTNPLYTFNSEIELTLRRLRKIRNNVVNTSSSSDSTINSNLSSFDTLVASSNILVELGQMENNDRTLKELATPDVVYQPWCIQYPQLEPAQTYELKSGLIHLLPKFHGLAREDPHKHLKEFHVVCSTMRP